MQYTPNLIQHRSPLDKPLNNYNPNLIKKNHQQTTPNNIRQGYVSYNNNNTNNSNPNFFNRSNNRPNTSSGSSKGPIRIKNDKKPTTPDIHNGYRNMPHAFINNNNIAHLTLNHQFINTSGHNNIHNNISYSVVNNPNHNVNNSTNTIQYKYQLGRPPLSSMSSSNSASKTRIPLPSSPRNGIASAMNSNNTSSSNINYYLSGNHTTTNHNSISRQSLRMNSTGNNNNSVRTNSNNNSLHSSRKNYCLHKNNSVYNLSKCLPSSNTCRRPNISSLNQQPKRNNNATNVFKSYKVSSSSSYSTNASANKNAK